jgi:hypothetical protein
VIASPLNHGIATDHWRQNDFCTSVAAILACQDDNNNKMSDGTVPAEPKGRPSLKSKTFEFVSNHTTAYSRQC